MYRSYVYDAAYIAISSCANKRTEIDPQYPLKASFHDPDMDAQCYASAEMSKFLARACTGSHESNSYTLLCGRITTAFGLAITDALRAFSGVACGGTAANHIPTPLINHSTICALLQCHITPHSLRCRIYDTTRRSRK